MDENMEKELDEWLPSPLFEMATVPHYLHDQSMQRRLSLGYSGDAPAQRTLYQPGKKLIDDSEKNARKYRFFESHQSMWSTDFIERLTNSDVGEEVSLLKAQEFISAFKDDWVDGRKRRQDTPFMIGLKRSILEYHLSRRLKNQENRVIEKLNINAPVLFSPDEMGKIFDTNKGMVQAYLEDYLDHLGNDGPPSLSELYVRRGVYMPAGPIESLRERYYLSSYSLALGPVEMFAQTRSSKTKKEIGRPCIFSAPVSAIQDRIVAFAPFIRGMDIEQLEFVVAPPVTDTRLRFHGIHGGIEEYSFA